MSSECLNEVMGDAAKAIKAEQRMTLWQALKVYPHAVKSSVLLSASIMMVAFGQSLIPNLLGLPAFQQKFGQRMPDGSSQISPAWQTCLTTSNLIGAIVGLAINGIIVDSFGYRKTILGGLVANVPCIFLVFFAEDIGTLFASQIIIGIPWGVFETLTTTYAADVCPVSLRAYLTTYVNLCWVIGQMMASGVLRAVVDRNDEWAYKIPFALLWVWPVPLIVGVAFIPESPWWLVRKDRIDEAKKMLLQLTTNQPDFDPDDTIAMMVHTNNMEKAMSTGTSYLDCFRGTDLRRTEIACFAWAVQTMCGAMLFMSYSSYFYIQAGLDESNAYSLSLGQWAIGAAGTVCSWFLVSVYGRRTLYLAGEVGMFSCLLIIGCIPGVIGAQQWAIGSMLLLFTFIYDVTVGPVCYSLVAELPSTRLRTKTVVLARTTFHVTGLVVAVLIPRQLNTSAWGWGPRAALFWAGSCFLCIVWTFARLPEPKGRTYGELDVLFARKTPARRFASATLSVEEMGQHEAVMQDSHTT